MTSAEAYGKIIIDEFDPNIFRGTQDEREKKKRLERLTIKPISIGGRAGGVKFVHRGILFKFALDWVLTLNRSAISL